MKYLIFISAFISTTAFSQSNQFIIKGKAEGLKDSTKLYLRVVGAQKSMASAYVINEMFEIRGIYPENDHLLEVSLYNNDYSHYKTFWIDGSEISFTASKDNFMDAQILGSSIQLVVDEYIKLATPYRNRIRTLAKEFSSKTGLDSIALQDSIRAIESMIDQVEVEFIRQHPSSVFSANLLGSMGKKIPVAVTKELYSLLPSHLQNSKYGQLAKKVIDFKKEIKVGNTYVDFEQRGTDGKMVRLSEQKYEYLLLEFWFSHCGPCVRENPKLVEMYKEFHPKGFEIVGVSVDGNEKVWLDAVKRDGLPWINVCELTGTDNTATIIYGVYEYPTNFLINKEGKIIAKNLRGEELNKKLAELFGK
jgi:peroxiredoxin